MIWYFRCFLEWGQHLTSSKFQGYIIIEIYYTITQNEQFPLLPQCFQLSSILRNPWVLSYFSPDVFGVVCCILVVCVKDIESLKAFWDKLLTRMQQITSKNTGENDHKFKFYSLIKLWQSLFTLTLSSAAGLM